MIAYDLKVVRMEGLYRLSEINSLLENYLRLSKSRKLRNTQAELDAALMLTSNNYLENKR